MTGSSPRAFQELDALTHISDDELRSRQDERLAKLVRHHFNNPYNSAYRTLLRSVGIEHESDLPRSVDEIGRLPLINRTHLLDGDYVNHPAVPPEQVRKIIETSGTSGNPLRVPHTFEAVRIGYGDMIARSAALGGMDPEARLYYIVHWVPGGKDVWASHEGALMHEELVGSDKVRIVSTHTTPAEHWRNLQTFRPVWACGAPPSFLAFEAYAEREKLDLTTTSLTFMLLGATWCPPEDRHFLKRSYGLDKTHFFYPTSESFVSAAEVPDESAYLCFEDEFIVEVVDHEGKPVAEGERGRVAITCLSNEGYPGIRYLQGDAADYVGRSSDFAGFSLIKNIRRMDAGEIGEARLSYAEIEAMPRLLAQRGVPVRAIQIARRREDLKDVPVFRIETSVSDRPMIEKAIFDVFMLNPQMKDMVDGGIINPPVVEIYEPGTLSRGRFKVPLYVDERHLSS